MKPSSHLRAMCQFLVGITLLLTLSIQTKAASEPVETIPGRWTKERINAWYDDLPWLVGANYYPASAINQIEMWQASTWDPDQINEELKLAGSIGMNIVRVYLHDLVWADDEQGLYKRMNEFLDMAYLRNIRTSFVFFDDCHYPSPRLGKQPLPVKGWHNSGWVNSPARELAHRYAEGKATRNEVKRLKGYVQKTMEHFRNDHRILYWELYNEPGRGKSEDPNANNPYPESIGDKSNKLVLDSWRWAREVNPSQPITSTSLGSLGENNVAINRANSDFHSVHAYADIKKFEKRITQFKEDGRPIIVTEWLARPHNTPQVMLPIMKKHNMGAINWGFIAGKSQTTFPWSTRSDADGKPLSVKQKRDAGHVFKSGDKIPEPKIWFHDLYRKDFTPFDEDEIATFVRLTKDNPAYSSSQEARDLHQRQKPMDRATIEKGLKTHDRALHLRNDWIRDPYIILGPDDYYYLTGTTPNPDDPRQHKDPFNNGLNATSVVGNVVRIWRSKDLVDWEYLGEPYTLDDKYPGPKYTGPNHNRMWAPELHWIGDRWAIVHCPGPIASFALAPPGLKVKGPWTHPMKGSFGNRHDPSLFKDDDGRWWVLWSNTLVQALSDDLSHYLGQPKRIDPSNSRKGPKGNIIRRIGHEGATIRKIGNKYVHFGTAWSTDTLRRGSYNMYYSTADKIDGNYGPRKFAGRFIGHGTPFQTRDGNWWITAFYNADVLPLTRKGIQSRDIGDKAQTINRRGTTIVPLDVRVLDDGEIYIRAKDPDYANPGPDEAQKFPPALPY